MTKAASLPLCLLVLLATGAGAWAQTNATDAAIAAALHRTADTITLHQRLGEAKEERDRKELANAARLYDEAYVLVQSIGPYADAEAAQAIAGLTAVRMELARAAQKMGELNEANRQVVRVLNVDPKNSEALAFQKGNDKLLAEM